MVLHDTLALFEKDIYRIIIQWGIVLKYYSRGNSIWWQKCEWYFWFSSLNKEIVIIIDIYWFIHSFYRISWEVRYLDGNGLGEWWCKVTKGLDVSKLTMCEDINNLFENLTYGNNCRGSFKNHVGKWHILFVSQTLFPKCLLLAVSIPHETKWPFGQEWRLYRLKKHGFPLQKFIWLPV